jgi:hypothetical protein
VVRDCFEKEGLTDGDLSDILAVWEAEKHLIFKQILNNNAKSAASFQGMHWGIRKGVAARNGKLSEAPAVNLHLQNKEHTFKIAISKEQFGEVASSVSSGVEFLNELFQAS